jgi:delta8-fatty-acid desaturase
MMTMAPPPDLPVANLQNNHPPAPLEMVSSSASSTSSSDMDVSLHTTATADTTEVPAKDNKVCRSSKVVPMTRAQVLKVANPKTLCLMIIHNKVYDCTRWQNTHPGGYLTIRALCGKDATDAFSNTHPMWVSTKRLDKFYYADLKEDFDHPNAAEDETILAFRELTKKMEDAGLFETDLTFYYKKLAQYACMLAMVLTGVLCSDSLVVHGLAGCLLGLFWQQMAYVGHDIGHNAITHHRETDSALGLIVGNLLTGVSMAWWKRSHNVHHIVTNSIDYDPDIQHLPFMAVDPVFVTKPVYSTYQEQYLPLNNFSHLLVKFQHWLYYPVMAAARINLYAQSICHAFCLDYYARTKDLVWHRELQIITLAGFWMWLTALTLQLPTWQSRILFLVPAHVVAGILHVQITVSHFAMPTHEGVTYDNSSNGYIKTQLDGTMDIDCPTYMDWFHGGIQFQVVHHLWPRLPRHNLRHVKVMLMAFCKEHGLEYKQKTFLQANIMVIQKLKETSKSCKGFSEFFSDAINLRG